VQVNDLAAPAPERAARYKICTPRVAHQTIDGETVIIDFDTGAYFSTARIGAALWDQLAGGATVEDLIAAATLRYNGAHDLIAGSIRDFVRLLERETLIAPAAEAAPSPGVEASPPVPAPGAETPVFEPPTLHKYTDMADLLLLDPIHDVDESGWPSKKP